MQKERKEKEEAPANTVTRELFLDASTDDLPVSSEQASEPLDSQPNERTEEDHNDR